jgi:hypothetical protein
VIRGVIDIVLAFRVHAGSGCQTGVALPLGQII